MSTIAASETTPMSRPAARAAAASLIAGAVLALGALTSSPAWAHDTLIASTPEADEVLEAAPEEIVLEFSGDGLTTGDNVTNDIWVLDEEGENWASEDAAVVDGSTMSTDLSETLPNGEYEVLYRVVYSDGHDEELSFDFEVADPGADNADNADDAQDSTTGQGTTAEDTEEDAEEETGGTNSGANAGASDADQQEGNSDATPTWMPILFAAGAFAVIVVVLILVRQKIKASEQWRADPENPGPEDPENPGSSEDR